MTAGAVAAGSPLTVEAGLAALRRGGNAVDAAVAASLMASVAEPLLTGLGGGGMGIVRMNGEVEVLDMMGDVPGQGRPATDAELTRIEVDFGPTTQVFHAGPASVAVPGLPAGLWALHERHGKLPMTDLAEPAARAAEHGVPVTAGFARVIHLLQPILGLDPAVFALFSHEGVPLTEGQRYRNPDLAATLRRYATEGPSLFTTGPLGREILRTLGSDARLTALDLAAYEPRFTPAIRYRYRDATVWLPSSSSVAGLLVAQSLRTLEDSGPMAELFSASQVRLLAHSLRRADRTRGPRLHRNLREPGFIEGFLAAIAPEEEGEERLHAALREGRGAPPREPGNTTHISVVDADGNAVGLTHSLGETCGRMVPGTGLFLNNFLGESDVYPADAELQPGDRLLTMCCPSLVEIGDAVYALGTGGSSRIRSAILQGVVYLVDHGLDPERTTAAPRVHVEAGRLFAETHDRPPGTVDKLAAAFPRWKRFGRPAFFFGGLHIAGLSGDGFSGAGDARRSGAFGVSE